MLRRAFSLAQSRTGPTVGHHHALCNTLILLLYMQVGINRNSLVG